MKRQYFSQVTSLLLAGALLVTAGCGYKTDPVPPQTVVPKAIDDLTYTIEDDGVTLNWSYPDEAVNGKDLEEIMSFDVFRAEVSVADYCPTCPIPFTAPQRIDGGIIDEKTGSKGTHFSGMLRAGHKYFFKVRARTSRLAASADSNIVSFVFNVAAAAPTGLKVVGKDKAVVLSWNAVTKLVDGKPVTLPVVYQVLKSTNGKDFKKTGGVNATGTYTDTKVQQGATYFYKVQSATLFEDEMIPGGVSAMVSARVVDSIPPEKITGLTVVASTSNYRIFWDASSASDLAGYKVYRRSEGEKKPVVIGRAKATQTLFVDDDVQEGATVYYSVAAFDTDGNEGPPSDEATTRY